MHGTTVRDTTFAQKLGWVAEVILGLIVPLVFFGPAIALGLLFGFWGVVAAVVNLSLNGVVANSHFLLPALGGLLGLVSVAILLFKRNFSRRILVFCALALLSGVFAALYLLLPASANAANGFHVRDNRGYWMGVLAASILVGLRRLVIGIRTSELRMSRVRLLVVMFGCLVGIQSSYATQPDFRLQVVPAIVYKVDDPGNSNTSSFVFNIAVICSADCELSPISARVELSSAGSTVERQDWTTEMLAKIKRISYRILPNTPLGSPTRLFTLPEAFVVLLFG